jgi:hypothetical protein
MTNDPRVNLRLGDPNCPHCGGQLAHVPRRYPRRQLVRCQKCGCRWVPFGELVSMGARCPLLVRA